MKLKNSISVVWLICAIGCADPTTNSPTPDSDVDISSAQERSVVTLTDAAVAKFEEVLASETTKHIRLSVKNEGPTGFRYDLQLDDSISDSDWIDRTNGFLLVVDSTSSLFLEGATIDWQTQADGTSGFKFYNPNAVDE